MKDEKIDTRIDFASAKKADNLELLEWPTRYGDFKFYIRKNFNERNYNIGTNVSKGPKNGEYMKPFFKPLYGDSLTLDFFNKEDVWLDAGGHIGAFSVRMAKQFPKIKKILCYEAMPHNMSFAIENAKINGVDDKIEFIEKCLVPDDREVAEFSVAMDTGKHSLLQIRNRESIQVPTANLSDSIIKNKVTCMKMDVEGAEYDLLKSVKDWSTMRILIVEYHFHYKYLTENKVEKFREIIKLLEANFDEVRYLKDVELGKNFITHIAAIKK